MTLQHAVSHYHMEHKPNNYRKIDLYEGHKYNTQSNPKVVSAGIDSAYITIVFYLAVWAGMINYETIVSTCIWGLLSTGWFLYMLGIRENCISTFFLIGIFIGLLSGNVIIFHIPLVGILIRLIVKAHKH